jgi:hypothetical protein
MRPVQFILAVLERYTFIVVKPLRVGVRLGTVKSANSLIDQDDIRNEYHPEEAE